MTSLRERWKDWWETSFGCEDHERTSGWRVDWSPLQIHSGLSGGGGGGEGRPLTWIIPNHGTHRTTKRGSRDTLHQNYSFYWIFVFFFSTLVYYLYRWTHLLYEILYLVVEITHQLKVSLAFKGPPRWSSWLIIFMSVRRCCYITVDSATTALQNGACTYQYISLQMHYNAPFSHNGYTWKVWKFMKITSLCSVWKKQTFW